MEFNFGGSNDEDSGIKKFENLKILGKIPLKIFQNFKKCI